MTYPPAWPAPPPRRARAVAAAEAAVAGSLLGAVLGVPPVLSGLAGVLLLGILAARWRTARRAPDRTPGPGVPAVRPGVTTGRLSGPSGPDAAGILAGSAGRVVALELGGDPWRLLAADAPLASLGGPAARRAHLVRVPGAPAVVVLSCPGESASGVLRRAGRALERAGVPATVIPADRIGGLLAGALPAGDRAGGWAGPAPRAGRAPSDRRCYRRRLDLRPDPGRPRLWPGSGRPGPERARAAPVHAAWTALAGIPGTAALVVAVDRGGPAPAYAVGIRLESGAREDLVVAERHLRRALRDSGARVVGVTDRRTRPGGASPLAGDGPAPWGPPAPPPTSSPAPQPTSDPAPCRQPRPARPPAHPTGPARPPARLRPREEIGGPGGATGPAHPPARALVLGTDRAGLPFGLPLFGPRPTRLSLVADRPAAARLAIALAEAATRQGVATRIRAADPALRQPGTTSAPSSPDPDLLLVTDAADHPPPGPRQCLLTVHTGGTVAHRTGGPVLVGRLRPEWVDPLADDLGIGAARQWLARIPDDLLAVVDGSGLRWIRVEVATPHARPDAPDRTDQRWLSSTRSPPVNGVEP